MEKSQVIYGVHPVVEAMESGKELEKIFLQAGLNNQLTGKLRKLADHNGVVVQTVPVEKLNRLVRGNHQGVVGFISSIPYVDIEDLLPGIYETGRSPLILVLDRITDVRNFGAIARTALCSWVDAIIIPSRGSAQINEDAIKTSAGALLNLPICRSHNLKNTIDFLKDSGLQIISCTEKADQLLTDTGFTGPTAIIMGSEEEGISPEYLKKSDITVSIPQSGRLDSYNVSVAAGMILYEAARQRGFK